MRSLTTLIVLMADPRAVFNLREGNPLIDTECSICFEDVQVGDRIARLSCLCYYHEVCISSWLSRGHHCPFHQE